MITHLLKSKPEKFIFLTLLALQLIAMLIMSQDIGISADEFRHYKQAEKVYNYYKSDGDDKSALENSGIDPMQYNGQAFDNAMYVLEKTFNVENNMEMRHFFNALIGWLIILLTGLIAKDLWGYKAAILAIFLLFITPRFIGHALNNNKDIPFAFGFLLSFYGMFGFFRELPKVKIKNVLFITLGIAFAISIRLAGILNIALFAGFSALSYLVRKPYFRPFEKRKLQILKKLLLIVPVTTIIGYFLGIAFWPFMMSDPITNIQVVLEATSSHPVKLAQLFDGQILLSDSLPATYSLSYLLYTYPLTILTGIILAILLVIPSIKKDKLFDFFMLLFSFVFVFTWMSLKNTNLYGGIRHLTFIYPLAILIAVAGFQFLSNILARRENKYLNTVPYILVGLLSLNPLIHLVKNYPYSYVYFNQLIGGVENAADKYETDYFQHSLKHATQWLIENKLEQANQDSLKIKIVTNDAGNTGYYLRQFDDKVDLNYTRYYEKYVKDWDYAIFYCGYIPPNQIKNKKWPPVGTIHTENVDGFPIAAVVQRPSKEDYEGFQQIRKRKPEIAREHFLNYLKEYPSSEEAYEGLARTFMIQRNFEKSLEYADSSLVQNPRQIGAWLIKTTALNSLERYNEALLASEQLLNLSDRVAEGHFQRGFALARTNKANEAMNEFQLAIAVKEDYYQAYMQLGSLLINYSKYKNAIEIYKKLMGFKPNDFYATIYSAKCYHLLKNNEQAEKLLNSLPKNSSNNLYVVKVRIRILMSEGEQNMADQYFHAARGIQRDSELYVLRAMNVLKDNNKSLATEYLNKAIELDNTNQEARNMLKKLPYENLNDEANPKQTQSIMFQQTKKKNTSPIKVPTN